MTAEVLYANSSSTEMDVEDRITAFSHLQDGWSYSGDGIAFQPQVLASARRIARCAKELNFDLDALPGVSGEMVVATYTQAGDAEFIVFPEGTVTFFLERDDQRVEETPDLTIEEAIRRLRRLGDECLSESSTLFTTSQGSAGLTELLLATSARESPYSPSPAL